MIRRRSAVLLLALIACAPTGERSPARGGTVVISAVADADILFPPLVASIQGKQVVDQIFDPLAAIGQSLNTLGDHDFTPVLAERWEWAADSLAITFHLDPRARWHDGRPVTAEDVRYSWQITVDPALGSPLAAHLADVAAVDVLDSLRARIRFHRRSPEQFSAVVTNLLVLPAHLLSGMDATRIRTEEFVRRPVGSGRFRFVSWEAGQRIELHADTANYRGPPVLDRVIWWVAPDFQTATIRFLAGEADFIEFVRPEDIADVERREELRLVPYSTLNYGFMAFNFRDRRDARRAHPLFASRELRRALSFGINREALVLNALDTLGRTARGPFPGALAGTQDVAPLPHDSARAARMLDSLGWRDSNGDGVRDRDGRQLRFGILVPTSSALRVRFAVLLQAELAKLGARLDIESMEANTFYQQLVSGRFDTMINGWQTDPSPASIRQLWSAPAPGQSRGSNFISYANAQFDALVDSASMQFDPARRTEQFQRAYQTIIEDAPAVWLFEIRPVAGVNRRVATPPFRADAWWSNIAEWSVRPTNE